MIMKKRIALIIFLVIILVSCTGCYNKQLFDVTYHYDRAIVYLPNGEIVEGRVSSWADFDDGDSIQVKIDGKMYLTHISNVCLIDD